MQSSIIQVFNIIGTSYAVDAQDGETVFESIKKYFDKKRAVKLSFLNIELATTSFLNTAIGKLYGSFDDSYIAENLIIVDFDEVTKEQIEKVKESAKMFYKDPQWLEESIKNIVEGKE